MLSDLCHPCLGEAIETHSLLIAKRLDPALLLKMSQRSIKRAWFQPEIMRAFKLVSQFSSTLGTFLQTEENELSSTSEPTKLRPMERSHSCNILLFVLTAG